MKHSTPSRHAFAAALLLTAIGALASARGQEAAGRRGQEAQAQNPAGVSFTIRFKDGRTQFRQGEVMTVELAFSSSRSHAYILDAATYDRSGRLNADDFHLSPGAGYIDPLGDYYESGLFGFSMGGIRGTPELESKPYVIPLDLNEWVRFDRPGRYRLYVTNKRVSRIPRDGRTFGGEALDATSNTIEFEILPADAAWAKQKLSEALAVIDSGPEHADLRRVACRQVRFLNTQAAAREMIRRLGDDNDSGCSYEFDKGLMGSPHRQAVIEGMEATLAAPDYPVNFFFIQTLSFLRYVQEHGEPMPPYPTREEERALWQAEMRKRRDDHRDITRDYVRRLSVAVRGKQKRALAVSLATILTSKPYLEETARDEQLASSLVAVFSELSPRNQQFILSSYWKQVGGPDMLPVLRRIYEKTGEGDRDLRDVTLKRINELAPDEGRRLILAEIKGGRPRVRASALGLLPEETLPELDDFLATRLEQPEVDYDAHVSYSWLLARYASPAALPRVRLAFDEKLGKLACEIQTNLLNYMLRVDPAYGAEALERSLAARKETDTRCYSSQLANLPRPHWRPELTEVALAHLNDPNPEVMSQAAYLLGQRGPATAEQPLWEAFERWHARYGGMAEAKLRAEMKKADVQVDPSMIEQSLVRALGSAGAWVTSVEKLKRLGQLCVTEECRREVASLTERADGRVITVFFDAAEGGIQFIDMAQYRMDSVRELKDKLAQFPQGTAFLWSTSDPGGKASEQLFAELQAYLKERGMGLEKMGDAK